MLQHEALIPASRPFAPPASPEPTLAARAFARLRAFSLDRRLAAGEDPSRSALLAARAAHLTAPRRREQLAAALNGLLVAAERGPRLSRISPARDALRENETAVRELARRVDSRSAVYARGLARLDLLVSDATGPAYRGSGSALSRELGRIEEELGGRPDGAESPPPRPGPRRPVRRLARTHASTGRAPATDPRGFVGGSFTLPDGSWFHGRREG